MSLFDTIRRFLHLPPDRPSADAESFGESTIQWDPPVVTSLRVRLAAGQYDAAVRAVYQSVVHDLEMAYGLHFSDGWTNGELIANGFPNLDKIALRLHRLYQVYAPIRYGPPQPDRLQEPVEDLVLDLYSDWRMYQWVQRGVQDTTPAAGGPREGAP